MRSALPVLLLWLALACAAAAEVPVAGRSLPEALDRIADQAGIAVIYNSELVAPGLTVAVEPRGEDALARLRALLEPFGLTLEAGPGNRWLVVRQPLPPGDAISLPGTVRDRVTGLAVAGARVAVYPGAAVQRTAADGVFELEAPRAELTVLGSHPDYQDFRLDLHADDAPGHLAIDLVPRHATLAPMTVTASHYALLYEDATQAQFLSRDEVDRLPHVADDVFRALHWLPGVARGDFGAAPHVRGGAPNELAVELDGLTLHQPYHLKDLLSVFSVIDSNAIDGMEFYAGVFPARFGNAASGVLSVDSLSPGRYRGRVGISFINAFAQGSGTVGDNGWWLASGRTGYLDIVLDFVDDESGLDPRYGDFLGKIGYDAGPSTRVALSTLLAVDRTKLLEDDERPETLDLVEGDFTDAYLWLTVDHDWSDALSSRSLLFAGTLERDRIGIVGEPIVAVGRLADDRDFDFYGLEQTLAYRGDRWNLEAGFEVQRQSVDYRYRAERLTGPGALEPRPPELIDLALKPEGSQQALFGSIEFELGARWRAETGLRYDRQTYREPTDDQWSPRASLLFMPTDRTRLRLGLGRFHQPQGIDELQVEDGVDRFFRAQRADQVVAALEHRLAGGVELRVESYYKAYDHVMPYFDQLFDDHEVLPELRSDRVRVAPEKARAKGIEVDVRKFDREDFRWWATYSYARAEERIGGRWVPRDWDQPHAFNAGVSVAVADWNLTLALRYHTGWPTTPVARVRVDDATLAQVGPRNSARHGIYHRLDLRASRRVQLPQSTLQFYLEIINLYNRSNDCCRDAFTIGSSGRGQRVLDFTDSWLPFMPSLGVKWSW